ncbi:hypothetical protein C8T65DRAFT_102728 [Cerioporus squamosus]|nr:hypothetical protein C8T65DRAFT_102728 [Cerioporus squamosus]
MLVRSKQAPLHVVASVPTYGGDRQKAVKEVMANFARIRTLQLAGARKQSAICSRWSARPPQCWRVSSCQTEARIMPTRGSCPWFSLRMGSHGSGTWRSTGFSFAWDLPLFCSTLTTLVFYGRLHFEASVYTGRLRLFYPFSPACPLCRSSSWGMSSHEPRPDLPLARFPSSFVFPPSYRGRRGVHSFPSPPYPPLRRPLSYPGGKRQPGIGG